jgi:uronate dehydrogenase
MPNTQVLITGASGKIGGCLLEDFRGRYDVRAFDRHAVAGDERTIVGDLQDAAALRRAMSGVDVLVHLAATPREAPFVEELVPNNVVGVYNTYQAAQEAGVRRIVFASSVQAVAAYPPERTIEITDPPRPSSLYGATKVLGEVLGRYYHDRYGIEFVGVRIGWFLPYDSPLLRRRPGARSIWLSPGDAVRLFRQAVEQEGVGYALVFGTSVTEHERLSRQPARALLGFEPEDDVARIPLGDEDPGR